MQPPIRVETELARIPVIVTDRSGTPIPYLTAQDFNILEDGRTRKIAFFEHIRSKPELLRTKESLKNEVSNEYENDGPGAMIVILMDLLNTSFTERDRVRKYTAEFLSETTATRQLVALMALEPDGIYVIHGFTTNTSALAKALEPSAEKLSMKQLVPESAALEEEITLNSLREISEGLAGIPGRKSLIWITGGMGLPIDHDPNFRDMFRVESMYQDTWLALNRAEIAVYPKDVEGLARMTPVADMEEFAKKTGGRMCYAKMEIDGCFREAARDSSDYYILGFYPEANPQQNRWRNLTVQLDRADAKVHARTSYFAGDQGVLRSRHQENEDIALGLASPLDYTDLPLTVRWTGIKEANGKQTIGFEFLLKPGVTKVDEANGNHVSMVFTAMAVSSRGKVVGQYSKRMEVRLEPVAARNLMTIGGTFPGQMELPSGQYGVRFVARDNLNVRMGSISTSLTVP